MNDFLRRIAIAALQRGLKAEMDHEPVSLDVRSLGGLGTDRWWTTFWPDGTVTMTINAHSPDATESMAKACATVTRQLLAEVDAAEAA